MWDFESFTVFETAHNLFLVLKYITCSKKNIYGIKLETSNQKMVNTGGDERFEKFKTSSKFKPVQRNKKSKVKIDKRFKSMLQKVCSFFTQSK